MTTVTAKSRGENGSTRRSSDSLREKTMQTKRIYQAQHWLGGQWSREHNWCKVEAFGKKEAAEKVCGVALTEAGKFTPHPRPQSWAIAGKRERPRFMQSSKPIDPALTPIFPLNEEQHMPDMKAQTLSLHEGDKVALEYLGAAVVLQWSQLPEDVRKALLQQADSVGGLPLVPDLHEQIQALIRRVRTR